MTLGGGSTMVLVPIRSFDRGKTRLAHVLPAEERSRLARHWATGVLHSAGHLPVAVLTGDPDVGGWAREGGATVLPDEGWDLNSSLAAAVRRLQRLGADRAVIASADLPLADDLTWLPSGDGVVIVPDRRADGTNVLAVPTAAGFRFSYGRASSHHHDGEALRLGLRVTVVRDPLLAWDIDVPEDLRVPDGSELQGLRDASLRVRQEAAWRATPTR